MEEGEFGTEDGDAGDRLTLSVVGSTGGLEELWAISMPRQGCAG